MRLVLPLLLLMVVAGCGSNEAAVASGDAAVADAASDTRRRDADVDVTEEPSPPPVPKTLAETGLYADFAAQTLATGVRAYDVRWPLWSDGADKARYLFVPAGKTIDTTDMDHWVFPLGTKAWKEFRVGGKLVETRYVEKTGEPPIGWRYVSYVWSADGKAALAAPDGVTNALGTGHDVPDQAACENCHSGTRDGLLGVGAIQQSDGKGTLAAFASAGLLDKAPAGDFAVPGTGVVQDALGYLHGNCGYCHSDHGRWSVVRPLRLRVPVGVTDPTKTPTYATTIGKPMAHSDPEGEPFIGIVPGDAAGSHVYVRMTKRDFWAMPPVGSKIVDDAATATIKAWIDGLPR